MSERHTAKQAVFVIIHNDAGEILLQQRQNTGYLDGYWDFPSGHIEAGEAIKDAAVRELREEVDLETSTDELQLVHINQNYLDTPYINYTFKATRWEGTPRIGEPDKIAAIRFFSIVDLPERCSLNVRLQERTGFGDEVTFSLVDSDNFAAIMGEPYNPADWGKK